MKRITFLFISFLISHTAYTQTKELEIKYLDQAYKAGELSITEYKQMAKDWSDLLSDIGGYPTLPYDEDLGVIRFELVKTIPLSKQIIFKRIKEWAALSFGSIKEVLHYEDFESGKIILKGYFNIVYLKDVKTWFSEKETINSAKCSHTYMFTIKENKIRVNVLDLKYEFNYYAYSTTGSYSSTITKDLTSLYPIVKSNSINWKSNLSIIKNTELSINSLVESMNSYVANYDKDYSF